jgi:ubiquinone/menaquinone biosynthesis C-methylase UbiE
MSAREYEAKGDYVKGQASNYDAIRFSSFKGRLYDNLQKNIIRKMLSLLPKDLSIIDLPCGTGRITEVLTEFTTHIVCGDISDDMLGVARQKLIAKNENIVYRIIDAEKIDFQNNSFDLVTTIKLMHLIPLVVQARVLREIVRVSKRWVIVTYAYNSWLSWVKDYVFRKKYDKTNPSSDYPRHVSDVIEEVRKSGCEVRGKRYTFRLFSSEVIFLLEKPQR